MAKLSFLILLPFVFGACATVPPTATPLTVYRIASTPELETLVISWLKAYQEIDHHTLLEIEIVSPQVLQTAMEIRNVDLIISAYVPPEGWFATPLMTEKIAVVVNPGNQVQTLQSADLALIFSGKMVSWSDLGGQDENVQPVIPLQGEASREKFQEMILRGSPFALTSLLAPTPAFARQFVRDNAGGIGFILDSNLSEDVQEITITADGSEAGNLDSGLILEILAMWSEEPPDGLRAFLVWLQGSYLQ